MQDDCQLCNRVLHICRITTYPTFRSLATFQVDEVGRNNLSRLKKNLIGTKNILGGGYLMKALTHLKFK